MSKKISPEQELEMVRLYRDGNVRGHRLAGLFRCSTSLIYRIIKRHGVQKGPALGQQDKRKIKPSDEHAAMWLYTDGGASLKEICAAYDCSFAALYNVINRYDVPRRNPMASEGARQHRRGQPGYGPKRVRSRKNKLSGDAAFEAETQRRLTTMAPNPFILPPRQAVSVKQVSVPGLKPADVVLQVMPSVPEVSEARLMGGRGQPHRMPVRGFVFKEDAA